MKKWLYVALVLFIASCKEEEKKTEITAFVNPIYTTGATTFDFAGVTPERIREASAYAIAESDRSINNISQATESTFESIMLEYDRAYFPLQKVYYPLELLSETNPDSLIRIAASEEFNKLKSKVYEIEMNEAAFAKINEYSQTEEAKQLTGARKKWLNDVMNRFKVSGLQLDEAGRKQVKKLKASADRVGMTYRQNIAATKAGITINTKDTAGMSAEFLAERKQEDGAYFLDVSSPTYGGVMAYAKSDALRKDYMKAYYNRGGKDNLVLLDSLIFYRQQLAKLLGFKNYSELALLDKMGGTPEKVWEFENSMVARVKSKGEEDIALMKETKAKILPSKDKELNEWETGYISNYLEMTKYQLDDEKIKEYFELNAMINGVFGVTQKLLGLRYEEVQNPNVWHPEVRMFNCYEASTNALIGRFYLDLFPRENKYSHAACFPLKGAAVNPDGSREIAEAALVCNFPKPTADKPALMKHSNVETFFHEFGHLIHNMVSESEISYYANCESVALDFIEAPSQIYENWAFEKEVLSGFAKHYQTGEVIPDAYIESLRAAQKLNAGVSTLRQLFLGSYDLYLHSKYVPFSGTETTTDVCVKLKKEIMSYNTIPGTHFESSFGHLVGYGSGYYGYMWSKVYAQDMWSVFIEKGIYNQELGKRYRNMILKPGGSKDPMEMVTEFLGREPRMDQMLKDIGVN